MLLLACGDAANEIASEEEEIATAVEEFFAALGGDLEDAYALLAQPCQDQIPFSEFAADAESQRAFLSQSTVTVENVVILDRRGAVVDADIDIVIASQGEDAEPAEGALGAVTLVQEDGVWHMANCENFEPDEPPVAAIEAEADDDPGLPGEFVGLQTIYGGAFGGSPSTGPHVAVAVDYAAYGNSNPPAGGPHWSNSQCGVTQEASLPRCGPVPWGIYDTPWAPESLVHNMEHAGVVLWYNTNDQEIIVRLEELVAERLDRGERLVLAPYFDIAEERIAITAWSRIDTFGVGEYSQERVDQFIDAHLCRFDPEELCR